MSERDTTAGFWKRLRTAILPVLLFLLAASAAWAAPAVTTVNPPDGSSPPVTTTVSATFSEPMDPATITSGSFTVTRSGAIKAIAAGRSNTVVLKTDGTVVAWGYNGSGQNSIPPGLSGVVAIAAGSAHTLALKNDGTVVAWGDNSFGQGTAPTGLSGVVAIATKSAHSLALKNDGTVVAWGDYRYGQTTVPSGLTGVVAIAAGARHSLALKNDGTVVAWGDTSYGAGAVPPGLSEIVAIAAGPYHSLALKNDGTVVAWGDYSSGQTVVPSGLSGVVAIVAGFWHSMAMRNDGTVVAWGPAGYAACTVPPGLSGVVAISSGFYHSLALKNDGTMVAWGENKYGESTLPPDPSGVVAISAKEGLSKILKNDGTVFGWGYNFYDLTIPPDLTGVTAISEGVRHVLALKNDGTVVAWGYSKETYGQTKIPPGLSGVIAISAGGYHSLALKNNGTVVAWGGDYCGVVSKVPPGLTGVVAISSGMQHSLALKNDGTVVAWGCNSSDQTSIPPGLSGVIAISAGPVHSLALKNDGTVVGWGAYTGAGQATIPPGLSGVVAISAGGAHSLALKNDGTVVGWGKTLVNYHGESEAPTGLSGVVAIAAGSGYSLVLKNDGTVVGWGSNDYGQSNMPALPKETSVQGSVAYDPATNTATFTPSAPLEPGFTYFGTVTTGMRSAAGAPLAADVRWSFIPVLKSPATITLSNLNQLYDGGPKPVTATTNPPGLAVSITYNGSAVPPTETGSYTVAAVINDPAYLGSAAGTLTITNPSYIIGVSIVGGYGSISCDSPVIRGGSSTCSIAPDANYHLASFTDNSVDKLGSVPANSYVINNVTADHTIIGTFAVNLTANAGPNQTITCSGPTGALATLDGSASTGAATYSWSGPFGSANGVNPTVTIPWGTHTITLTVTDGAGKTASSTVVITVTDTVPPLVNVLSSGVNGNNGWFRSDIDLSLNAADSCSGMREIRYTLDSNAEQVVSGATAGFRISGNGSHTVTYRGVDNVGNDIGATVTFKIDSVAPAITGAALTAPNANGWYNGNVTVRFNATDALSGMASLTPDTVVTTEGAGQVVTGTAADMAGNSSAFSVTGINLDKSAPMITITGVANGATYSLGLVPAASFVASDALSGVATSGGSLTEGAPGGLGQFTYTVAATDKAGNSTATSVTYTVIATPAGLVELIEQLLAAGQIDQQMATGLINTLNQALASYNSGNSNAGDGKMGAFINKVEAPGQGVAPDVVAQLVNAATYIINNN